MTAACCRRTCRRIDSLLKEGAVIVCAKPTGSPGLSGYPQSDAEVKSSTLWNDEPVRSVGKGKLYTKGDTAAASRDFKITPHDPVSRRIRHRRHRPPDQG